jgi:hypothetical protein
LTKRGDEIRAPKFNPVAASHFSNPEPVAQMPSRTFFVSTRPERTPPPLSNAEQETEAAAERLNTQIEAALASVATRNPDDAGELEAYADRIERSARDLSVALRELARRRRNTSDE